MRTSRIASACLLVLLLVLPPLLFAEETPEQGILEGHVRIKGTREPVAYAQVELLGTALETTTDEQGHFRLEGIPAGEYALSVKEDTIKTLTLPITIKAGDKLEISLYTELVGYQLDEIVVSAERQSEEMAAQTIQQQELTGVPGTNNDPIRVLENMPGVANTSVMGFGNEGLVIRGVSAEDSRYLLNGFEIPQLFHFGGWVSIVNSELISDISYYPGSYSVGQGSALGGVVELTSRSPRHDRIGGVADLNSYASFLVLEGPAGEKMTWAAAGRRSFIDFILPEVVPEDQLEFTIAPRFYDYTAIFEYNINTQNTVQALFLGSDDAMSLLGQPDDEDPLSGDSFEMWVGWQRADVYWTYTPNDRFTNKLSSNFLYLQTDAYFGPDLFVKQDLLMPAFRDDASLRLGEWNELRFGVEGTMADWKVDLTVISPPKEGEPGGGNLTGEDVVESDFKVTAWFFGAYMDDVMQPASWVQLIPGARVNYHEYMGEAVADPRLTINFFPTSQLTLKLGGGIYHQWPNGDELMDDLGNPDLEAEAAYQGSLGTEYDFGNGYSVDVQGYYKQLDNLVSPTETGAEVPYENTGIGHVYGAELLARKKLTDRLFGWLSYTYSVSERRDRPDSDWRLFDQDQTHNFVILASYMLGENKQWRLGAKWQYFSGLPYTDIQGAIYNADADSYLPLYSDEVNGERNDDYHALDIRIDKLWTFNTWTLNTYLDVQNVYWNEYPFGYRYNFDYSKRKPVSFPAFMPTLGFQARF